MAYHEIKMVALELTIFHNFFYLRHMIVNIESDSQSENTAGLECTLETQTHGKHLHLLHSRYQRLWTRRGGNSYNEKTIDECLGMLNLPAVS